ncbi:MAG: hypothetical protein ACLQPH_10315, partial [Acidimicrobiales bacterium]
IAKLYAADFALTGTDPSQFTPGKPVVLDQMAMALLRMAGARNDRTLQLNRSYQSMPALQLVDQLVRRAKRRLFRLVTPR